MTMKVTSDELVGVDRMTEDELREYVAHLENEIELLDMENERLLEKLLIERIRAREGREVEAD